MAVPPRLTYVTLAVRNMAEMRQFFGSLGWQEDEVVGDCIVKGDALDVVPGSLSDGSGAVQ